MSATLEKYAETMPTVFSIAPALTKTVIENKLATIPAAAEPAAKPEPTAQDLSDLFDELVSEPTFQAVIEKNNGLSRLGKKYNLTASECQAVVNEIQAAKPLYATVEVEDVTPAE